MHSVLTECTTETLRPNPVVDKSAKGTGALLSAAQPGAIPPAIRAMLADQDRDATGELADQAGHTPITTRARRLAPLHQRAALAKAMRLAGIHGRDHPSLDVLAAAENPPAAVWRDVPARPPAAEEDIRARAISIVEGMAWKRRQTMLFSKQDQLRQAAEKLRWRNTLARLAPRREVANRNEYTAGQALAAKWAAVLEALDDILTHAELSIPHLSLAALSEAELRVLAKKAAVAQQERYYKLLGGSGTPVTPEQLREMDTKTHLRRLRAKAKKARQYAAALFGTVGQRGSIYSDAYSLERWNERQASARAFAADRLLVLANGKTVPLSDVLASSMEAHKARLYAMAKGIDDMATRLGWAAAFVTLTLPPEYHPNPSRGANSYDPSLSPCDADAALAEMLTAMRAEMRKKGITPYGICVKEPHRDGTPHAHAMLYMLPEQVDGLDQILLKLRPEPVEGERIATKLVRIDRTRAKPPTYLFKYLMKSVNAPADEDEDKGGREDGDHLSNHDAVRAWASERGIRRWATWGTHGVQRIWQAIQQRKAMPEDAPAPFQAAWLAIVERRYADALEHMGAVRDSGNARMRLVYEDVETEYGDTRKAPCGVRLDGDEWTMPLKAGKSEVLSRGEHLDRLRNLETYDEDQEAAADMRWFSRLPAILQNRFPAVVVSYPSGHDDAGEDGNPRSTAGPPKPDGAVADPAKPHESHPTPHCNCIYGTRAGRAASPREQDCTKLERWDGMSDREVAARIAKLFEGIPEGLEGVNYF